MALAKNSKGPQSAKLKIRRKPNGAPAVWDASWQNVATERVDRHLSSENVEGYLEGALAKSAPEQLPLALTVTAAAGYNSSSKPKLSGLATAVMAFDIALVGLAMALGSAVFI